MGESSADRNREKYDKKGYFDSYIFKKTHLVRVKKSLDIVRDYVKSHPGELRLLDIGCGDGQISVQFKALVPEVYGVDIAEGQVAEAKKRGIKAATGDIDKKLPFEDKSFDIIFCGEVIEHVIDARPLVLEMNRLLKDGGLLVLTTPNLVGLDDRVRVIFGLNPRHTTPLSKSHYLHIRPFTFGTLKSILEKGGFRVDKFCSNKVRLSPFVRFDLDSYWLANIFPNLGAALIIGAAKTKDVKSIELVDD